MLTIKVYIGKGKYFQGGLQEVPGSIPTTVFITNFVFVYPTQALMSKITNFVQLLKKPIEN